MTDEDLHSLARDQHNRLSRTQLEHAGLSKKAIEHRARSGRLVRVIEGVYAFPPLVDDARGTWMTAALSAPQSYLNRLSAACAWGALSRRPPWETVVRPGTGGPRVFEGIVVYRSTTLNEETTVHDGIPITTVERTILDLACFAGERVLARALRESIRLELTTTERLGDYLGRARGRKGSTRFARTLARYSGLPIERARSGAEIRALELLRDAGLPMPELNVRIAGEEADLSWPSERLIVEIDGRPYHLDRGQDARKAAAWREAGWRVERLGSDSVYEKPAALLALAPVRP